jgi:hypothetical protein
MSVNIRISPPSVAPGGIVAFRAEIPGVTDIDAFTFAWTVSTQRDAPAAKREKLDSKGPDATWTAPETQGPVFVEATASPPSGSRVAKQTGSAEFEVIQRVSLSQTEPLTVSLRRGDVTDTIDQPLWHAIASSAQLLSFENYTAQMDAMFCDGDESVLRNVFDEAGLVFSSAASPFADMYSYKLLKVATEAFLIANCAVPLDQVRFENLEPERLGLSPGSNLGSMWRRYLRPADGDGGDPSLVTLPYLALVRRKLPDVDIRTNGRTFGKLKMPAWELCYRILQEKLRAPTMIELIWSYWMEQGGLVQTLNAISLRFQNRRGRGENDPLANLTIDPLRPLNNLLWGYIQDEQHRLSLVRRAHEYDHEYGLALQGRAVPPLETADPRARFLEAFHNLLTRAAAFYRDTDDTTTIADAFPVLNALREVHLLLSEGAHNQYGDLPWTARHEMLMQQWLLARPEFSQFLATRTMVVYPEPWMDRVDAMKRLQGWTDVSVRHFRDLAVFGEQILLSIRYGDWSNVTVAAQAANWAGFWRTQVQWYIHAYQSVTGVDLGTEITDTRPAEERYVQPSVHLQRRELERRRQPSLPAGRDGAPAAATSRAGERSVM